MTQTNSARPLWPIVLFISAAVAALAALLPTPPALRFLFMGWFLFFCPGMAFVQLANIEEPWLRWVLAVVLSIALDAAVAIVLLYAGLWSIELILFMMILLTLFGAVIQALEYWLISSDRTTAGEGG